MVQIAKVAATEPKEIKSEDYGPMTDPANVRRFLEDYFSDMPQLVRIGQCESHFRQFNKHGQVQRGEKNSYDVGVMQINELYHADEAKALGIDIYTIDGNVAFARKLYERSGDKPWKSSSPCWSKSEDLAINPSAQAGKN
ncbi:hypothetical protein KW796_02815 [Candidatus Parcubacteria bacterium]|nr:hypothetical protein [Candidatus Parcubacteria bacterium]